MIDNILFLDIETVPEFRHFENLSHEKRHLWESKTRFQRKADDTPQGFYERAGIYAEFGRIICIGAGYFDKSEGERRFRLHSFRDDDEKTLLVRFVKLLDERFSGKHSRLCAHNGKEFDFPFICRRMVVHDLKLPTALNVSGKKPWETSFVDTLECWKFGDHKNYTSLQLLANVLGIPTPKDDIGGGDVRRVYYEENDMARIASYCSKDVITVCRVFLRIHRMGILSDHEISLMD
jgi:predicted PolB exonuclease-like 3'-5' exonuclease